MWCDRYHCCFVIGGILHICLPEVSSSAPWETQMCPPKAHPRGSTCHIRQPSASLHAKQWKRQQARGIARECLYIKPHNDVFAGFCPGSCLLLIKNPPSSVDSLIKLPTSQQGSVRRWHLQCFGGGRRICCFWWTKCLKIKVPHCCLFFNTFCATFYSHQLSGFWLLVKKTGV